MAIESIDATTFRPDGVGDHDSLDTMHPLEIEFVRREWGRLKSQAIRAITTPNSPAAKGTKGDDRG
jgi:hypothetical protein